MVLNENRGNILKFINILSFDWMSQLTSVMFPSYLFLFDDDSMEELLRAVPLSGEIGGERMSQRFYARLLEINIPIHKLVSVISHEE
jgi:hypothetical protein